MSILIKGMEMPTSCARCRCAKGCPAVNDRIARMDEHPWFPCDHRHEDCPLVPVPPHGRCIDADALRAKQQEDADLFQGSTAYCDKCRRDEAMNAVANIVNAPTILEAEEGE